MISENGFMQFWTDVYNFLKDQGALRQSLTKLNVDTMIFFLFLTGDLSFVLAYFLA